MSSSFHKSHEQQTCRQEKKKAPSTGVRSDKSVAAPSCWKPSTVSVYNQLGPFGEEEVTERKCSELSNRNSDRKSGVSRLGVLIG